VEGQSVKNLSGWTNLAMSQLAGQLRKGGWAIAQSPILNTTITIERLERRGYESLSDLYFKLKPKPSIIFPTS
jgi:hypothetical protein